MPPVVNESPFNIAPLKVAQNAIGVIEEAPVDTDAAHHVQAEYVVGIAVEDPLQILPRFGVAATSMKAVGVVAMDRKTIVARVQRPLKTLQASAYRCRFLSMNPSK